MTYAHSCQPADLTDPPAGVRPGLFLRNSLANPLQMGSVVPSSAALCRRLVQHAWPVPGQSVLELGAGTGVISCALLQAGLAPDRLVAVKIEPKMAEHLRRILPGVTVIAGDARGVADLLPQDARGRFGSVVCGIPLVLLPRAKQTEFIGVMQQAAPSAGFLHYSDCITSLLPAAHHGLAAQRLAWTPLNFPPASVWRYAHQPAA